MPQGQAGHGNPSGVPQPGTARLCPQRHRDRSLPPGGEREDSRAGAAPLLAAGSRQGDGESHPPAPGPQRGPFPREAALPLSHGAARARGSSFRVGSGPRRSQHKGAPVPAAERRRRLRREAGGEAGAGRPAEPPAVRAAGRPMKVRSAAGQRGAPPGASPSRTAARRASPRPQAARRAAASSPRRNFSLAAAAEPPGAPALRTEPARQETPRLPRRQHGTARPGGQQAPGPSGTGPPLFQPRDAGAPAPPPAAAGRAGPALGAARWRRGSAEEAPSAPPSPDPINGPCPGRWGRAGGRRSPSVPGAG
ncbi:skin secretory protein xP2-like [Phasianus colchicus]|uniref:skin secretory protein xP2-like n=1 Tax=Phasianus colchicus TaxID=9054 RepID=UPI00129E73E9|nr:skin secretory protein xP2-like [Phasianus colchicus]